MRSLSTIFATAAALLVAAPSYAAIDATKLLAEVDEALNRWDDQYFEYTMEDTTPGKSDRTLSLNVYMKGEKRVTEFVAPPDVRGMRILILSDTQMYAYLPAFKKVRRIASHATAQGFMGTAYSQDDLAVSKYSPKYTAKLVEEKEGEAKLELNVKSGEEVAYPKIHMTVDLKRKLPVELTYFDDKGTKLKTESRGKYECEGNICVPTAMKMVDHTTPGHSTTLVSKKWKLNKGLKKRIFSRRYIQRGR